LALAALGAGAQDLDQATGLYRQGKYSEAEAALRKVVANQGSSAAANRYLGLALIEQGKTADAEQYIKKANELDSSGENKAALARLYAEQKDYDKAKQTLNGAEGDQATYTRALVALNAKQYDEAARDFESFLQSNPEHAYSHYYAGMAYNGMKRPDKMLTHFELFLKLRPDAPEARKVQSVLRAVK